MGGQISRLMKICGHLFVEVLLFAVIVFLFSQKSYKPPKKPLTEKPYADEPHNYGLQVGDYESLHNLTLASDRVGLQVAIHAIGDRANDLILDMYESVISKNGVRDRRFRIEHAQHLAPGTPARFGELGIVASVQVLWIRKCYWNSSRCTVSGRRRMSKS